MKTRAKPKSTSTRPRSAGKRAKTRSAAHQSSSVSVYDAKAGFSQLLDRVAHGQEVVITRHGNPVARILPMESDAQLVARREEIIARMLRRRTKLKGVSIMDIVREAREGRR